MTIGTPLHEVETHLNALYYGEPGTGKTTAALGMAKYGKVLLIDAEGGAQPKALAARGVDISNVEIWPPSPSDLSFDSLEALYVDLMNALEEDPDAYYGLVIDSFTELARRLLDKQLDVAREKAERLGKNREAFQIDLADHGVVSSQMRTLLRRFRDLNLHLVLTALERRDVDENTAEVNYGPALGPAIANDTMGLVDLVVYFNIEEIGGRDWYIGNTVRRNRRKAKDRFGVLPPRMVDPSSDRLIDYVSGELTKGEDPLQLAIRAALRPAADTAVEKDGTGAIVGTIEPSAQVVEQEVAAAQAEAAVEEAVEEAEAGVVEVEVDEEQTETEAAPKAPAAKRARARRAPAAQ